MTKQKHWESLEKAINRALESLRNKTPEDLIQEQKLIVIEFSLIKL